jgi:hypothetical protein
MRSLDDVLSLARRHRAAGWLIGLSVIVMAVAGFQQIGGSDGPRQGDALHDFANSTWSAVKLDPGQRFVLVMNDIVNDSDRPLTIKRIEPISRPNEEVALLESIELTPRIDGGPSTSQGSYMTYPPGLTEGGTDEKFEECIYQEIIPAGQDHILEPYRKGENEGQASTVMVIRTVDPGSTSFETARVVYEQDGRLYEQHVPFTVELTVAEKGPRKKPAYDEVRCADAEHSLEQPPH